MRIRPFGLLSIELSIGEDVEILPSTAAGDLRCAHSRIEVRHDGASDIPIILALAWKSAYATGRTFRPKGPGLVSQFHCSCRGSDSSDLAHQHAPAP